MPPVGQNTPKLFSFFTFLTRLKLRAAWAQFVSYLFPQLEILEPLCSQDESADFCFKELCVQEKFGLTLLGVHGAWPACQGANTGFLPTLPKK